MGQSGSAGTYERLEDSAHEDTTHTESQRNQDLSADNLENHSATAMTFSLSVLIKQTDDYDCRLRTLQDMVEENDPTDSHNARTQSS